jgi:hypothetical protein
VRKKTKSLETRLRDTAIELAAGKRLLAEKAKTRKAAKSKIARKNAARAAEVVEDAVESIAKHRELLKRQQKRDATLTGEQA